MNKVIFVLLFLFYPLVLSAQLFTSEHNTESGQAELNSFPVDCEGNCFFMMFLEVRLMDFESEKESGAMYRVWNKERTEFVMFGISANKQARQPEIKVISSQLSTPKVIGSSKLESFEGFPFEWTDKSYKIQNLRSVPKGEHSAIQASDISYSDSLPFKPYTVEYLFLGVSLKQYLDATNQNINPQWKKLVNGS
jgi:hypothetical protein